jgi:hypothetical protein
MNKEQVRRVIVHNALYWCGAAMMPMMVMIVLDFFDCETAARVGLWGSVSILLAYAFAFRHLSMELTKFIPNENSPR